MNNDSGIVIKSLERIARQVRGSIIDLGLKNLRALVFFLDKPARINRAKIHEAMAKISPSVAIEDETVDPSPLVVPRRALG